MLASSRSRDRLSWERRSVMKSSPRTIACILLFLYSTLGPLLTAKGQTPPTYPELFVNPPQTEQLTQADFRTCRDWWFLSRSRCLTTPVRSFTTVQRAIAC